jgi:hypothetical protein
MILELFISKWTITADEKLKNNKLVANYGPCKKKLFAWL